MYQGDLISTKTFVTFDVYIFVGMFLFNINNSAQYASALFRKTLSKGGGVNGFQGSNYRRSYSIFY